MKCLKNQRGFTLIEILIAMSISAVVIGGLAAGIYAVIHITGRGNSEIKALRDIQSAAYWISNDAQMAKDVVLFGGDPSDNITLNWDDNLGEPHTSNFALSGNELIRNYDDYVMAIAWNVDSAEFSINDDVLSFTIISVPDGMWNTERKISGQVNLRAYP